MKTDRKGGKNGVSLKLQNIGFYNTHYTTCLFIRPFPDGDGPQVKLGDFRFVQF